MGKKKAKTVVPDSDVDTMDDEVSEDDAASIEDGKIVDYITGKQVKESPKEKVRQRIARAIFHEYGFSPDDMEPDYKVKVGSKRKGVDIAIFKTGAAYQEIVGDTLRGDRGQFFTPSNAVKLMVEMLAPTDTERVIDPACGTGGFLRAILGYLIRKYREEAGTNADTESTTVFVDYQKRLKNFAKTYLFGADFDPSLVRASQMNVVMACNQMANIFHMNSLEFPEGNLTGVEFMKKRGKIGSMDVVMTNPPFGSDIPVTDPNILKQYELAYRWERTEGGGFRKTESRQGSVAPEILFIERCLQWLRPGGRMGIVLPDGILGNPGDEYIRWWIMRHAYVLASVDLPVECFIVEANVNILTSLLLPATC